MKLATRSTQLERSGMAARDYSGGEGLKLMRELLRAGALIAGSVAEAIESTRKYTAMNAAGKVFVQRERSDFPTEKN